MKKILIQNIEVEGRRTSILINGNTIAKIADVITCPGAEIIDGTGKAAIPGLVNMHTHAAMTLMRGVEEDIVLSKWLQRIWAIESRLDSEMIYWGTKLAIIEMIHTGTTTFLDHYWHIPQAYKAAEELGIRGYFSFVHLDGFNQDKADRDFAEFEKEYQESFGWEHPERFSVAIHADYTNSEKTICRAAGFAHEHNLMINLHASETEAEVKGDIEKYGMTPIERFDKLGVLGPDTVVAHGLWLTENDISILGEKKVSVAHNINSNLKLSSGYKFYYNELRDAGANVCLGTDGPASNNNLDMLESMKYMAMLQKAWRGDPSSMPLNELMDVATVNGAKALKLNAGKIAEGKLADIVLIDKHRSEFIPDVNFIGNLIYAAGSSSVDTVICDGKVLMSGGKIDAEDEILDHAAYMAAKLLKQ